MLLCILVKIHKKKKKLLEVVRYDKKYAGGNNYLLNLMARETHKEKRARKKRKYAAKFRIANNHITTGLWDHVDYIHLPG